VNRLSKSANAGDGQPAPTRTTPPARDTQLAFRENFSWRANAALELFIARHTTIDPIRRANLFHETVDDRGPT